MNGRLLARDKLDNATRARMYRLLDDNFAGVTGETFHADLAEKNWVILLEDDHGALVGFSTLLLYGTVHEGEPITVVYSGDTIVSPAAWGSSGLARTWINAVWRLHAAHGTGRLFWLLITSGYRTYRFLSVFWRCFYPCYAHTMPKDIRVLRDRLAHERFGAQYDATHGVVRFAQPQRLRAPLRDVPARQLTDPHVACFLRMNPGHANGDELVCLTELSEANLTRAGRRMVDAGRDDGNTTRHLHEPAAS